MSKFAGNNLLLYPKGSTVCQNRTEEKGHGLPLSHLWNAFTHDRRENTGAPAFQLPKHFFGVLDKSFLPLSCLLTKSTDAKCKEKEGGHWFLAAAGSKPSGVTQSPQLIIYVWGRERNLCLQYYIFLLYVAQYETSMNNIWAWNLNTFWVLSSCSISTQRLKYQSRKSAYQAFPAALQHILIAIHNILQKVVLCHSYVVPHCSETLAFNTKWYNIMLKRGKK